MSRLLSATNDVINCGSPAALDNVNVFTWAAWIYPTSITVTRVIMEKNGSSGKQLRLNAGTNDGELRLDVSMSGTNCVARSAANLLTLNAWQFVAATFDGSFNGKLYRGALGGAVAEVSYLSAPTQGTGSPSSDAAADLLIGNTAGGGSFFPGREAEVFIFPAVLTANELTALANGILARAPTLYAPLYGAVSPEPDFSGNANNGTVTGATYDVHPPIRPRFGALGGWAGAFTGGGGGGGGSAVPKILSQQGLFVGSYQ